MTDTKSADKNLMEHPRPSRSPAKINGEPVISCTGIIDLHTHTNLSDGSMTPEELVELAFRTGIRYLSITDHDTLSGVERATAAAREIAEATAGPKAPTAVAGNSAVQTLTIIPGIEFGALYHCELHILGYFRQDNYRNLQPFIDQTRKGRADRNIGVLDKLNRLGFAITAEEVSAEAGKRIFGRPHIAAVMVKKGYCKSPDQAFSHFLAFGKKAYIDRTMPTPADCVAAITEAGGIAVIAHPVHINMKLKSLRKLIAELIPFGLAGLEVYYTDNTPQDTKKFLALADEFRLIATGGSDFHGAYKKGLFLCIGRGNLCIPDSLADTILQALNRQ